MSEIQFGAKEIVSKFKKANTHSNIKFMLYRNYKLIKQICDVKPHIFAGLLELTI